jgi:hypothetical protein
MNSIKAASSPGIMRRNAVQAPLILRHDSFLKMNLETSLQKHAHFDVCDQISSAQSLEE